MIAFQSHRIHFIQFTVADSTVAAMLVRQRRIHFRMLVSQARIKHDSQLKLQALHIAEPALLHLVLIPLEVTSYGVQAVKV